MTHDIVTHDSWARYLSRHGAVRHEVVRHNVVRHCVVGH